MSLACHPKWPWARNVLLQKRRRISMDHDCVRYINTFSAFFFLLFCLFLFLFPSNIFSLPSVFPPFLLTVSHPILPPSIFFPIPRLIFAVARDIRSDSVVSYRYMYPASMANGRHIDNNEPHTLFTCSRILRIAATMHDPPRLIGVTVSSPGTFT